MSKLIGLISPWLKRGALRLNLVNSCVPCQKGIGQNNCCLEVEENLKFLERNGFIKITEDVSYKSDKLQGYFIEILKECKSERFEETAKQEIIVCVD